MSIPEIVLLVLLILVLVLLWAVYGALRRPPQPDPAVADLREGLVHVGNSVSALKEELGDTQAELVRTQTQVQQALQNTQATLLQRVDQIQQHVDQVQQHVDRGLSDGQAKMWACLQERDMALTRDMAALKADFARQGESLAKATDATVKKTMETFSNIIAGNTMNQAKAYQEQVRDLDKHVQEKLDRISGVVDEKLQKTLEERLTNSFTVINRNLESVQQGLGSMKNLANSVGDLKKLMGNVKSRGMSGEVQLGAILDNVLPSSMVERNQVIQGSLRVEYAIQVQSASGKLLRLPIDAKFPGDTYLHLRDAQERGDADQIRETRAALSSTIQKEARDIHDKYLVPNVTTDFGILFLPFEGLYAEAVNSGLVEEVMKWNIVLAGPSTLVAILNCVLMVTRFSVIRKNSEKVLEVLQEVQAEFAKYAEALAKVKDSLSKADQNLDVLMTTRTNVLQKKLKSVSELEGIKELKQAGKSGGGDSAAISS